MSELLSQLGTKLWGQLGAALGGLFVLVVVGFVLGRFAPERRRYLRLGLLFFVLFVAVSGGAVVLEWMGVALWPGWLRSVGLFFLQAQGIHLAAAVMFFVIVPRTRLDVPDILRDLLVGSAYFVAFLVLVRRFGVEIWSLLATSAVASIVIGVSLQPTLASIFGGVALQLDGSVREGDWVRLPDQQEGRVREIRWRHTLIETRNGDTLVLPNAQLLQQQLLVLGRREGQPLQHRMWVTFSVDARVSPDRVIEVVLEALRGAALENVASNPPPDCICQKLNDSATSGAIGYAVRYWLRDLARDDGTSSLVSQRIHTALQRADIALALPQRRIITSKESVKAQMAEQQEELARRSALLEQVSFFDQLQPQEITALAPKLRAAPFCQGEVISRQDAEAHWLYILVRGTAERRVKLPSGADRHIADLSAPDVFGQFGLLTGAARRETVVATSRVECFRLDKADLRQLLVDRPAMAEEFSRKLAITQDHFEQTLASMGERPSVHAPSEVHLFESIRRFFGLDDESVDGRLTRPPPHR